MNVTRRLTSACVGGLTLALGSTAYAQPPEWTDGTGFVVEEKSGSDLTDYQVQITLDTATPIAAGKMKADGSDLRIATDCTGSTFLSYWIQSGINTATTKIWVKVPTVPANGQTILYLGWGDPTAAAMSSVMAVFDGDSANANAPYSSTNQVASGAPGGVTNSQRGFRFAPNEDVVAVQFGKNEPTGTTRYVTLFDFTTQAVVSQMQVAGPAGSYSYQSLADGIFLPQGQQFLLELYQGGSDGYYFGNSSQINPRFTYFDMRYCNECGQNTFPTNVLTNYHYGYPQSDLPHAQARGDGADGIGRELHRRLFLQPDLHARGLRRRHRRQRRTVR